MNFTLESILAIALLVNGVLLLIQTFHRRDCEGEIIQATEKGFRLRGQLEREFRESKEADDDDAK